jgi:hypothetical protein
MFVTDIVNIFVNPGGSSMMSFFFDLIHFFASSILGGMIGASVFIAFEKDKLTYHHAGLTEFALYRSTMILIKDAMYSFLGKPTFFDEDHLQKEYIPPQAAMEAQMTLDDVTDRTKNYEDVVPDSDF